MDDDDRIDGYTGDPALEQEWDALYAEREQLWSGNPNGALVGGVADLSPGRVLDVGCGEGADAVWLARQGWDVTALEVSGLALGRARTHARDVGVTIRWVHADLAVAGLPSGVFDLVSAQYPALLRTPDALAERALLDAVAPGGRLLFVHHLIPDAPHEAHGDHGDHGHDTAPRFDPADYVMPAQVAAVLDANWVVEINEVRDRQTPTGGAGAHHVADIVLQARRLG